MTNRRFVAFALFCSAELALFNQLYLTLSLEAERVTGSGATVSAVFLLYTVAAIAAQVRITTWCRARWSAGTSVAVGLALQGAGFLPLMISAPWLDTDVGAGSVGAAALAAIPVLIGTLVFAVGMMIAFPFVMALLPVVGSERLTGTYYGVFYLVSAITAGVVSWIVGGLIDLTDPAWRWSPGAARGRPGRGDWDRDHAAAGSTRRGWDRRALTRPVGTVAACGAGARSGRI